MKKLSRLLITIMVIWLTVSFTSSNVLSAPKTTTKSDTKVNIQPVKTVKPKEMLKKSSLGNISFKLNNSRSVSGEFATNGKELTLSLTDSSGITWTLKLPNNALDKNQKITMTAMQNIKSSTLPGKVKSGIVLSPDGLQFDAPVKLTISGMKSKSKSLIISGNNNGSVLDYTELNAGNELSANIYHFSTEYFVDDVKIQKMLEIAKKDYEGAVKVGEELAKYPIPIPIPPSYEYKCNIQNPSQKEIDDFENGLLDPERKVLDRIFSTQRMVQMLDNGNEDYYPVDIPIVRKLYDRLINKVNYLMRTYGPKADKLRFTAWGALKVWRMGALLAIRDNPEDLPNLAYYFAKARDYYLNEIAQKHDYEALHAFFQNARQAILIGGDHYDTFEKDINDLRRKLSFDLCYDLQYSSDEYIYKTSGKIPLKFTIDTITQINYEGTEEIWSGKSQYVYVERVTNLPETFVGPKSFTTRAIFTKFDPCNGKSEFLIDRFGVGVEKFADQYGNPVDHYGGLGDKAYTLIELSNQLAKSKLKDFLNFELELTNFSETAAEKSYTINGYGNETLVLNLRLVHTPK